MVRDYRGDPEAQLTEGEGQPVAWPVASAGDKRYRADWNDRYLLDLGIRPVSASKANEDRQGQPVPFDGQGYRRRNVAERLVGRLKESRRIFWRIDKTPKSHAAMIPMAFIRRDLILATC